MMVQIHPVQAEAVYRAYAEAMLPEIDKIVMLRALRRLDTRRPKPPQRARFANWFSRKVLRTDPCTANHHAAQTA